MTSLKVSRFSPNNKNIIIIPGTTIVLESTFGLFPHNLLLTLRPGGDPLRSLNLLTSSMRFAFDEHLLSESFKLKNSEKTNLGNMVSGHQNLNKCILLT